MDRKIVELRIVVSYEDFDYDGDAHIVTRENRYSMLCDIDSVNMVVQWCSAYWAGDDMRVFINHEEFPIDDNGNIIRREDYL